MPCLLVVMGEDPDWSSGWWRHEAWSRCPLAASGGTRVIPLVVALAYASANRRYHLCSPDRRVGSRTDRPAGRGPPVKWTPCRGQRRDPWTTGSGRTHGDAFSWPCPHTKKGARMSSHFSAPRPGACTTQPEVGLGIPSPVARCSSRHTGGLPLGREAGRGWSASILYRR